MKAKPEQEPVKPARQAKPEAAKDAKKAEPEVKAEMKPKSQVAKI